MTKRVRGPTLNAEDEDEEVGGTAHSAKAVTAAARISSPDSCAPPGTDNPDGARGGAETTRPPPAGQQWWWRSGRGGVVWLAGDLCCCARRSSLPRAGSGCFAPTLISLALFGSCQLFSFSFTTSRHVECLEGGITITPRGTIEKKHESNVNEVSN
jgi:hypothetical protein